MMRDCSGERILCISIYDISEKRRKWESERKGW